MKKTSDYEIKTVNCSVKISCELQDGLWNTFEYGLQVEVKNTENMKKVNDELWDKCLVEVEDQIQQSQALYKK